MRRTSPSTSQRHPWVASAAWGWRLELGLISGSFLAVVIGGAINRFVPIVLGIGAAALVCGFPQIRLETQRRCTYNHQVARLERALWHLGIVGRHGDIPRVQKIAALPVGTRYLVRIPVGLHFKAIESRCPEIAVALGARDVLIKPISQAAHYVEISTIYRNAFPEVLRSPLIVSESTSLWEPVSLGVARDGSAVWLGLPEHNVLIGGEPGAGKSVVLSTLVATAALDRRTSITLLDGKQVELGAWAPVADHFVGPDQEAAIAALDEVRQIMEWRYQELLATGRRKITPEDERSLHLVVIDELAFYLRGGKKEHRDAFAELLRDLVSRGRAAGIIVVAATQKPSHEVVPTWIRDLFAFRLAMRCTSGDASDTILGQGWAQQGYSAAAINPSERGVGYLLAEGGVPVLLKTPFLSDHEIDELAERAAILRGVR